MLDRLFFNFIDTDFSFDRRVRSDRGISVFDSKYMRQQNVTGYNLFSKSKQSEFREFVGRILEVELKDE